MILIVILFFFISATYSSDVICKASIDYQTVLSLVYFIQSVIQSRPHFIDIVFSISKVDKHCNLIQKLVSTKYLFFKLSYS